MSDKPAVSGNWVSEDNMFSGIWVNRETGQRITISNSMINENNEMILMTSIGQMSMNELSRYYVQDTDDTPEVSMGETPTNQSDNDSYLLPEDRNILDRKITSKPIQTIHQEDPEEIIIKTNKKRNEEILDKFFSDNKNIVLNIVMSFDFNEEELKTIMKYTDVTIDDICEYIYENIVNKENIKKEINQIIFSKLN